MSQESQYPLKNEVDEPSINAVYVILIVTTILIAVSIVGLRSYESMIAQSTREAREQAPTVELNEMREANKAKMAIINNVLAEQGKTK